MNYKQTSELKEMKALEAVNKIYEDRKLTEAFPILALECWASDSEQFAIWCRCPQCKELVQIVKATGSLPTWAEVA